MFNLQFKQNKIALFALIAFFVPLLARAIPELIMGQYVAGFDPVGYYVPIIYSWSQNGVQLVDTLASAPLLYFLLIGLTKSGISLIVTLKIMAPLLHGLLGLSIYYYSHKTLGWSPKKSLLVSLVACLFFIGLRASWDMLRVQLGLIFIFLTLSFEKLENKKSLVMFTVSALLVVLSDQYTAIIILSIVLLKAASLMVKTKYAGGARIILLLSPALIFFGLSIYANFLIAPDFITQQISFPNESVGTWFSLFGYSSYLDLVATMLLFSFFSYILLLPFAIKGFKHTKIFDINAWIFVCLVAAFSPVLFSTARYRWVLLIIYPLAFLTIEGLSKLKNNSKLKYKPFAVIIALMSVCFIVLPAQASLPYYTIFPNYMPSSMVQNSVPLSDCSDVVNALNWINTCANTGNSCLITHTPPFTVGLLCI